MTAPIWLGFNGLSNLDNISRIGIRNANVLPLPVTASTATSFRSRKSGIAADWNNKNVSVKFNFVCFLNFHFVYQLPERVSSFENPNCLLSLTQPLKGLIYSTQTSYLTIIFLQYTFFKKQVPFGFFTFITIRYYYFSRCFVIGFVLISDVIDVPVKGAKIQTGLGFFNLPTLDIILHLPSNCFAPL